MFVDKVMDILRYCPYKEKFTLGQAMKTQRGSSGIAVLFL
jgi:hypothetical protein